MSKKTAVEWFFEQIMYADVDIKVWREIYDQAKEMEKEQMLDIYINHNQYNDNFLGFDDYYNKTFKTE